MNWSKLLCSDRPRQSTNSGDHRLEFERDFDRAVFSTPVKRLQDKAQVFPLDPHDAVRTRLTHSLEVSAVARGLGTAIGKWLIGRKEIDAEMDRSIEAIAATCGLIHDLGNPPFGHSGEDAIRQWFIRRFPDGALPRLLNNNAQEAADFLNFEGNAQSLRLVGKLQVLADFNGLNLTYGTLSASCKYVARSHETSDTLGHSRSKPGFFASENDFVAEIRSRTGTGDERHPIAFLVEAADDIVYSAADIEDGVKKGVVDWSWVKSELVRANSAPMNEALSRMERILMAGRGEIPADVTPDLYAAAFRTGAIGVMISAAVENFQTNYSRIMAGEFDEELVPTSTAGPLLKLLKEIGTDRVYRSRDTLKLELMGRQIIHDLLDIFWEGAQSLSSGKPIKTKNFEGKAAALISENYRKVFEHQLGEGKRSESYCRLQLVTDHVCGMTDSFAKRLHGELRNA